MNNIIEVSGRKQFANGQDTRDLQVCYDGDVETQLMDAIDSVYDFLRLVQICNEKNSKPINGGHLKMETSNSRASGRWSRSCQRTIDYLAEATPKPVNYTYDPPAGVARQSESTPSEASLSTTREVLSELSLDTNGFRAHKSRNCSQGFFDPDEVKSVYYAEVERLLKRVTGAERVVVFDHIVRNPLLAERGEKGSERRPGSCTTTIASSPRRAASRSLRRKPTVCSRIASPKSTSGARFAAQSKAHAGALRRPSLSAEDIVPADLVYRTCRRNLRLLYNPKHRWYYFPRLERTRRSYSSATIPRRTAARVSARTRRSMTRIARPTQRRARSIEVRALVFPGG